MPVENHPIEFRFAAVAGALLVLSACTGTPPGAASLPPSSDAPADSSGYAAATTSRVPEPPAAGLRQLTAADVIGMDRDALRRAFGAAALVRHDLDTEIWQYRAGGCVLLAFLYPKDGVRTVHHLDARSGTGTDDIERCIGAAAIN